MMSGMEDQQDGMDTNVEHDLINAVKNNNESEVTRLINARADVNQTEGESGKTALFYANQIHNVSMVCELIDAGSNFSIREIDGAKEALLNAVRNGRTEVVRKLIHAGIAVDEIDGEGKTALFEAVCCSNETIVHLLVEEEKALVNARDLNGRTPLFYAITKSTEIASYLIEKEADVKLKDFRNRSVLSFFIEDCMMNEENVPSSLMSAKSEEFNMLIKEPNKQFKHYTKTLLDIVLCKLPLMCAFGRNIPPPLYIVRIWNNFSPALTVAKTYFEEQGNTDKMNSIDSILKIFEDQETFGRKCSELIKLLVDLGGNVNLADADGNTALHYVTHLPFLGVSNEVTMSVLTQLARYGLSLNARNNQNQTPLLFCLTGSLEKLEEKDKSPAMKTLVEVCTYLVDHGSVIEETTKSGESVFHLIIKLFQQGLQIEDETARMNVIDEALKLLELFSSRVVKGNFVNKSDDCGLNSPLHLWATLAFTASRTFEDYTTNLSEEYTFEKLLEKIQTHLLKCGALKNPRNRNEETPLHLCNTWSAVKILVEQGANPNDKDSSKRPPLLVAAMRKTFLVYPSHFYPDVQENAKSFFQTAISEMKLDPWTVDKKDKSVLGILIEFDTDKLSEALVDVACDGTLSIEEREFKEIFVSLLNAISRDQSLHTFGKVDLAKTLLSIAKERKIHVVDEPFNVCCETMISQWLSGEEEQETVQISIAKALRENGANLKGLKSYEELKKIYPQIHTIMEEVKVQEMIPRNHVSNTHKAVLDKVARRQECKEVNSICFYESPVKSGSFGKLFVGIDKSNNKEVAIYYKCFSESSEQEQEQEQEQQMINRIEKLDCEQVVRYFSNFKVDDSFYLVFELMEGNLDDYLSDDCRAFDSSKSTLLCNHVVKGLAYLHQQDIIHGNLNPTNIFFKTHPELCLKITYFDTSTHSWMSPELLETSTNERSKGSDIFTCGLLLHYILTKGKHPFFPADTTDTSESSEIPLLPEASHLVEKMIESTVTNRPTAEEAIDHPLFWTKKKKIDFLIAVGNQPEFECPRAKRTMPLTRVEMNLDDSFGTIVKYGTWNDYLYFHMPAIYAELKKRRSYDTGSVVELVRFIRNAYAHVSEDTRPSHIRKILLEDFVFLEYFPALVLEVYKAVTTHGWDQTRDEIKYAMNK